MEDLLDEKDTELLAAIAAARSTIDGPRIGDFVYFKTTGELERISHNLGKSLQTSPAGSFYIGMSGSVSFSGSLNPGTPLLRLKECDATLPGAFWFFHHGIAGAGRAVDVQIDCRVYITTARFEGFISGTSQPFDAFGMVKDIEQQLMRANQWGSKKASNTLPIERREVLADAELSHYQFGDGVTVSGYDSWDRNDVADFTKIVYIKCDDDAPDADSERVSFHVRFNPDGTVIDAYGLLIRNGSDIGFRPANQAAVDGLSLLQP